MIKTPGCLVRIHNCSKKEILQAKGEWRDKAQVLKKKKQKNCHFILQPENFSFTNEDEISTLK